MIMRRHKVRAFRDELGQEWEVVVGRESWGTIVAILVPRTSSEPPRQAFLEVPSLGEGNRVVLGMNDEGLQALLRNSVPKPAP